MVQTATIQAQQRWEYISLVRKTESYMAKEINDYGQSGWELVSMTYGKDRKGEPAWTAFLKRPYSGPPRAVSSEAQAAGATSADAGKEEKADPTADLEGFDLEGDTFDFAEEPEEPEKPQPPPAAEAKSDDKK